jgi:protein tyrosine phosphatase type 4A
MEEAVIDTTITPTRTSTGFRSRSSSPTSGGGISSPTSFESMNKFSLIELEPLKFIIMDCPCDQNTKWYKSEIQRYNVTDIVRVCEATYNSEYFEKYNIHVHDMQFKDGQSPPDMIINRWLDLVDSRFSDPKDRRKEKPTKPHKLATVLSKPEEKSSMSMEGRPLSLTTTEDHHHKKDMGNPSGGCIAVHCVAGLGRAPVLVAVALIEYGMKPLDAIEFIRSRRKGAFNTHQIEFLDRYRCRRKNMTSSFINPFNKLFRRNEGSTTKSPTHTQQPSSSSMS